MAPDRRTQVVGAAVVVLIAAGAAYQFWWAPSGTGAPAPNGRGAESALARSTAAIQAPDVHLAALGDQRPKPVDAARNLFRFKPKPTPAPPPPPPVALATPAPTGPPPPPPPPPITVKLIGIVTKDGQKIAALTDTVGHPESGAEGDVVFGRYRVIKIGVESVELSYLDGSGRRTIRLGG